MKPQLSWPQNETFLVSKCVHFMTILVIKLVQKSRRPLRKWLFSDHFGRKLKSQKQPEKQISRSKKKFIFDVENHFSDRKRNWFFGPIWSRNPFWAGKENSFWSTFWSKLSQNQPILGQNSLKIGHFWPKWGLFGSISAHFGQFHRNLPEPATSTRTSSLLELVPRSRKLSLVHTPIARFLASLETSLGGA